MIETNQILGRIATSHSCGRIARSPIRGFTLLEVIVAIGITTLIVGAIGTAIRMYFINLKQAQANMELTELARNTLNLMATDIRSAIQYKPVDVSGLQELLDSQAAAISGATGGDESSDDTGGDTGGDNGDGSGGDENTGDESQGDNSQNDESQGDESSTGDSDSSTENAGSSTNEPAPEPPANRPKFIGTNQEIYVDVSRLPRIDQYHPILHLNSSGSYTSIPTDVKGISYFVSLTGDESSTVPGGLYRREVDRATIPNAGDSNLFSIDAAAKQVAAEIVAISLRYFDGESWHDQWDSDELAGYPSAVEIVIVIDPSRANQTQAKRYDLSAADTDSLRSFRTVTKLPLAEILTAEEQELIANPTVFETPSQPSQDSGEDR